MIRSCKTWLRAGVLAASTSLMSLTALADATLIEQPTIADRYIRLGDLFSDAGEHAGEIVLEAPKPGSTRKLSIYELERMASDFGLAFERPRYLSSIKVYRSGVAVDEDDLKFLIAQNLQAYGIDENFLITLHGKVDRIMLPSDRDLIDISIENISVSDRRDRFSLEVLVPTDGRENDHIRINGRLQELRLAPVLARAIAPGEVIEADDIEWRDMPAARLTPRIVMSENNLVGQTVRRTLNPGVLINANDLEVPVVVEKGTAVIMRYVKGPMRLSFIVRAMEDGGVGDFISVRNPKSKTVVEARVMSPDTVEVVTPVLTGSLTQ